MSSSPSKPVLKLDWCSYEAAKYAVEHWHYSRRMPSGKLAHIGAWEDGQYIGAVIFGRGANNHLAQAFGLTHTEITELVRIGLRAHKVEVSRMIAISVRMLKRQAPGLRLVVSYADPAHDHTGAVYQAAGWIYDGQQQGQTEYLWRGRQCHGRSVTAMRGTTVGLPKVGVPGKHRYLMPLDSAMRAQIEPLRKPYPKRLPCGSGETDSAPRTNEETGGARPTGPLTEAIA
jgi:hypothetical protein